MIEHISRHWAETPYDKTHSNGRILKGTCMLIQHTVELAKLVHNESHHLVEEVGESSQNCPSPHRQPRIFWKSDVYLNWILSRVCYCQYWNKKKWTAHTRKNPRGAPDKPTWLESLRTIRAQYWYQKIVVDRIWKGRAEEWHKVIIYSQRSKRQCGSDEMT